MKVRFRALLERLLPSALVALLLLQFPMPAGAFHFPWDQGHDTFQPDEPGDEDNPPEDEERECEGDPVDLKSGNFTHYAQDILFSGRGPRLSLIFTYHSQDRFEGPFGRGWHCLYTSRASLVSDGITTTMIIRQGDGKRKRALVNSDGSIQSPTGMFQRVFVDAEGLHVVDKDGTERLFNDQGNLVQVKDRNGNTLRLDYDGAGVIASATDASGRSLTFVKNAAGRVASVTDPMGRTHRYEYDTSGNLTRVINPAGNVVTYGYSASHNLTTIVDARGVQILSNEYDTQDRVIRQSTPDGTTTYTYVDATQTRVRDARGNTTTHFHNDCGNPTTTIDPLGRTTVREWDANFNLISFTDGRGSTSRFEYDDDGNLTRIVNPLGAAATLTYEDQFNQISSITDPLGRTTVFNYDDRGNLVSVVDAAGQVSRMAYDEHGQIITQSNPDGSTASFEYDAYGNVVRATDESGNTTEFEFDLAGNLILYRDAEGRTTTLEYDVLDRLVRVIEPGGAVTSYEYDAAGNLVRLVDRRGNATTYSYDGKSRLTSVVDPLGQTASASYDPMDNLVSVTRRDGSQITFVHDAANQLVTKRYPDGNVTTFSYDAAGNLLTAADSDSVLTYTYDAASRIITVSTAGGPVQPAVEIAYAYDVNGNRTSLTDPTGSVTYEYDVLHRLVTLTGHAGGVFQFDYDNLGNRALLDRPNQVQTAYGYDADNRLELVSHARGASTLTSHAFQFDRNGRRIRTTHQRSGATVAGTQEFGYDALDQLVSATHPLVGGNPETFEYDAMGNRVSRDGQTQDSQFDAANRLLEDEAFQYGYDPNGNLTSKTNKADGRITRYFHDADDRLERIDLPDGRVVRYRYDAVGRRIEKDVAGTIVRYIYDREDILLEYHGAGNTLAARYLHGPGYDEPLLQERDLNGDGAFSEDERLYYLVDHAGTVTDLVRQDGSFAESYVYDAFGRIVRMAGNVENPYAFTAREYDAESGLYYFRARYMDPETGRFLSQDPAGTAWGDNRYVYAENDPINNIDPDGQLAWFIAIPLWIGVDYLYDEFVDPHVEEFLEENFSCEQLKAIRFGKNMFDLARTLKNPTRLGVKAAKKGLRRPYIRKGVRNEVERRAPRTPDGRFIDPNTGKPIDGKYDLGHKPGNEFRREKAKAEAEGLSQKEFNDRMNNPDLYQIEDPSSNRSHRFEMK